MRLAAAKTFRLRHIYRYQLFYAPEWNARSREPRLLLRRAPQVT